MANINVHTRLHVVSEDGDNITMYPATTASDVSLSKTVGSTTYTDLNTLVSALTSNAFSSDTFLTQTTGDARYLLKTNAGTQCTMSLSGTTLTITPK